MGTHLFPPGDPGVLYVVDLSSYLLRAYHAIGELSSPSGEPTNATFGTVSMLERLVRERRPALLLVAMDSGRDTFRRELYPDYKATRPPAPEDLKVQFARCQEIIEAFAIPVLKEQGVEADDLIAAAVRNARQKGLRVVIVGADKDLMQLVGDDVVMWDTMRDRVFGVPEVEERFGVRVDQLRDLLALMGDSSDNIPGVPHVGPKTARDLLVQYSTLEGVYEHLDQITKKALHQNLEQHRDKALISQKLVTLKDDSVIDFDLDALRWGGRDVNALRRIYSELGFLRQLHALDAEPEAARSDSRANQQAEPAAPAREVVVGCVVEREGLLKLADEIRASGRVAVAAQTAERSPLRPWWPRAVPRGPGSGFLRLDCSPGPRHSATARARGSTRGARAALGRSGRGQARTLPQARVRCPQLERPGARWRASRRSAGQLPPGSGAPSRSRRDRRTRTRRRAARPRRTHQARARQAHRLRSGGAHRGH